MGNIRTFEWVGNKLIKVFNIDSIPSYNSFSLQHEKFGLNNGKFKLKIFCKIHLW